MQLTHIIHKIFQNYPILQPNQMDRFDPRQFLTLSGSLLLPGAFRVANSWAVLTDANDLDAASVESPIS